MKRALLLGLAFSALTVAPASAQIVGSYDSGNCFPFTCNDQVGSLDYYELYNASVFSGAQLIKSVSFSPWTPYPGTILTGNYDITIGVTSAPIGGDPTGSILSEAGFYNGSLGATQFLIDGTDFLYDPTLGNLFLHIVPTGQPLAPNPGNGYLFADYTGVDVSRYYTAPSGGTFAGTGALVTTFNATAAVPEPATWVLMLAGVGLTGGALRRRKVTARVAFA